MGKNDAAKDPQRRHAQRGPGLPLADGNRRDAGPIDFRFVGPVVQPEADHAHQEGVELERYAQVQGQPDLGQAVVEKEQQQEHGDAAEELDVDRRQPAQRRRPVKPGGGYGQADAHGQQEAQHRQRDGHRRAAEETGKILAEESSGVAEVWSVSSSLPVSRAAWSSFHRSQSS